MKSGCTLFLVVVQMVVLSACNRGDSSTERFSFLTPTTAATQTPSIVQITTTPVSTYTPIVKVVTETPVPVSTLCVSAGVAVHLRPSPSTNGYPIAVLENGTVLDDLKGRDGKWMFVQYGEFQGWVDSNFVVACNKVGQ